MAEIRKYPNGSARVRKIWCLDEAPEGTIFEALNAPRGEVLTSTNLTELLKTLTASAGCDTVFMWQIRTIPFDHNVREDFGGFVKVLSSDQVKVIRAMCARACAGSSPGTKERQLAESILNTIDFPNKVAV